MYLYTTSNSCIVVSYEPLYLLFLFRYYITHIHIILNIGYQKLRTKPPRCMNSRGLKKISRRERGGERYFVYVDNTYFEILGVDTFPNWLLFSYRGEYLCFAFPFIMIKRSRKPYYLYVESNSPQGKPTHLNSGT